MIEILFQDPFLKNQSVISGSIFSRFIELVFMAWQVEDYQNILQLSCRSLAFNSYKAFFKKTKGLYLVSLYHYLLDFIYKENILLPGKILFYCHFHFIYFVIYWAICVMQWFVYQVVTSKIFEINLIFLIEPFADSAGCSSEFGS